MKKLLLAMIVGLFTTGIIADETTTAPATGGEPGMEAPKKAKKLKKKAMKKKKDAAAAPAEGAPATGAPVDAGAPPAEQPPQAQ